MTSWRLLDTGPGDGATNMAVDEALLASFAQAASRPVLRLYEWHPPALSLGRFQKARQVLDPERCTLAGVPVVRRITGGGVIYHAEELTYSLVCTPSHLRSAASVKESFRLLTSFLLLFYEKLGLAPRYAADHFTAGSGLGTRTDFCFAGKESYDILIDGKKIGGNAQRRLKNAIFQHGSIPLVDHAAYGGGFLQKRPGGCDGAAALADFGICRPAAELKRLLAQAFTEALPAQLVGDSLTSQEKALAASLTQHHASAAWVWEGVAEGQQS